MKRRITVEGLLDVHIGEEVSPLGMDIDKGIEHLTYLDKTEVHSCTILEDILKSLFEVEELSDIDGERIRIKVERI